MKALDANKCQAQVQSKDPNFDLGWHAILCGKREFIEWATKQGFSWILLIYVFSFEQ